MYSLSEFGEEYIKNVILKSSIEILDSERIILKELIKELNIDNRHILMEELYALIKVNSCRILESIVQEYGDTENHYLKIGYYSDDDNFIDFDKKSDDFTSEPVFEPNGWLNLLFKKELFFNLFQINVK